MSLDWNLSNVKDYKSVCWNGDTLAPVTECLIWGCLAIGMPGITDRNFKEYALRAEVDQRLRGGWLSGRNGVRHITTKEIWQHIGLRTNVTQITRAQFAKNVMSEVERRMHVDSQG